MPSWRRFYAKTRLVPGNRSSAHLKARTLWWSAAIVVVIGALAVCTRKASIVLGAKATGERLDRVHRSPHWSNDRFNNEEPMWSNMKRALLRSFETTTDDVPSSPVSIGKGGAGTYRTPANSGLRVTWFGHSSMLLEIDGVTVLTDPLWSDRPSPLSWVGPKRWYASPIALSDLPKVDVVMISHDHYDHLDRPTIVAMTQWDAKFLVPLGVGAHLEAWGIPATRIMELDWWESARVGALEIVATPTRHHSGRVSPDSDQTQWAGYAMLGPQHRVWYSGDTGFHAALDEIGQRFGPFDVTLIEAGQYDEDWPDWHLGPEQAVEAHRRVRGKRMIPVHWGLLKLAHHSWTEPAERVLAAAKCHNVDVLIPRPGESVEPTTSVTSSRWWPQAEWLTADQTPIIATRNGVDADRYDIQCLDSSTPSDNTN